MSPELKACLTDWLAWAERGGKKHPIFSRYKGLCGNIFRYYSGENNFDLRHNVRNELARIFQQQGLDYLYPFGDQAYSDRAFEGKLHKDPIRLAWVRKQLGVA